MMTLQSYVRLRDQLSEERKRHMRLYAQASDLFMKAQHLAAGEATLLAMELILDEFSRSQAYAPGTPWPQPAPARLKRPGRIRGWLNRLNLTR